MAAGAGASYYAYIHDVCNKLSQAVIEIVNSSHFVKKEFAERSLNLTQAYCLLWQESKNGEVDGKMELRAGAVCAAVVDLIVLDKIEIEIEPKSCLGFKYENTLLKVSCQLSRNFQNVTGKDFRTAQVLITRAARVSRGARV